MPTRCRMASRENGFEMTKGLSWADPAPINCFHDDPRGTKRAQNFTVVEELTAWLDAPLSHERCG